MTRWALRWVAAVVMAGWTTPVAAQGGARALAVADYLDLETVGDPQLSPDGKTVVYTRSHVDRINDKWESEVWIMASDGSRNRFLVKGGSPVWSPDGTRIAYVAASENPKGAQIFVRWMDAEGATSQITRLTEGPRSLRWSPDGKWISFASFVPSKTEWSIEMPAPPPNAKWTPGPRVVDRLHYRMDRAGYTEPGFLHLFVVPSDGGSPRQLTSGEWNIGAAFDGLVFGATHDWTPDGKTIVFDGLMDPKHDLAYQESYLYAVDVGSGTIRRLTQERGFWSGPVISPDGKSIAYAGREFRPVVYQTSDLHVIGIDGSNPRNLTRALDRDALSFGTGALRWASDGSGLYFAPQDRGTQNIVFAPVSGGPVRPVTTGTHMLALAGGAPTGEMIGVRTSFQVPNEIVRITPARQGPAQVTRLTGVNDDLLAGKTLATAEEIWYPSTGGARIQGWIVKPPGFDPSRKYPLLLEIHGGPQGMYGVGFDPMWQVFAAQGYLVLYTNPRGSTGYGDAFVRAIEKAYPSVDYEDLMAGVDTVIGRGYVDPKRLYVAGCSGGGVLSSWVIGHTTRFAAAAVRCPVTNWISMAGQTDVPLFTHGFFDKPFWEDPMSWFKQSSIAHVGKVTTPTLLMTGNLDLRTPMPQTEEYFAALKLRGIPTRLLRFEGEWHGTESIPSNWMRTMLYMMSWFRQHEKPAA